MLLIIKSTKFSKAYLQPNSSTRDIEKKVWFECTTVKDGKRDVFFGQLVYCATL